jgi:predicted methyltransferase
MKKLLKQTSFLICLLGMVSGSYAVAPDFVEKLNARPAEDRARDGARHPFQVMNLLGVEEGMTVLDIGSQTGWWTRVFDAAVGPSGTIIAQGADGGVRGGPPPADMVAMDNVVLVNTLQDIDNDTVDIAVTALNVHHGNAERFVPFFEQVKAALKPGGIVAVIDHIGDPNIDNSRLHRVPPANVREWIEAAGLEVLEESNLLRNNADDHTLSAAIPDDSRLARNTDRFLFVVRKPTM